MAHDKNTIHVSHYQGSAVHRSAVTADDQSWILFVYTDGDASIYRRIEILDDNGTPVTTYEWAGSTAKGGAHDDIEDAARGAGALAL